MADLSDIERAAELLAEARRRKRAVWQARRKAGDAMGAYAHFCEQHGIPIDKDQEVKVNEQHAA